MPSVDPHKLSHAQKQRGKMSVSNLVDNLKNMSLDSSFDPFYWAVQPCPVLHSPVDWRETTYADVLMVDLPRMNMHALSYAYLGFNNGIYVLYSYLVVVYINLIFS